MFIIKEVFSDCNYTYVVKNKDPKEQLVQLFEIPMQFSQIDEQS